MATDVGATSTKAMTASARLQAAAEGECGLSRVLVLPTGAEAIGDSPPW